MIMMLATHSELVMRMVVVKIDAAHQTSRGKRLKSAVQSDFVHFVAQELLYGKHGQRLLDARKGFKQLESFGGCLKTGHFERFFISRLTFCFPFHFFMVSETQLTCNYLSPLVGYIYNRKLFAFDK